MDRCQGGSSHPAAIEVIKFVKSKGLEIRFSSEDSFRSDLVDLLTLYSAVDKVGVHRVGVNLLTSRLYPCVRRNTLLTDLDR